ncbi:hypothetical protein [Ekhidna sp.]|jgi:hypothetical protein|uniref:hypothetical protein n=1 Tax=Ekhidna sp. TaxID=2608089 RepID=UPI0032EFB1FC
MINLSVDAADDLEGSSFDPTVNEIESIVELVLEVVLEKGDALPEHDEPDPEAETCLTVLDHIIPMLGLFDLNSKHCLTLSNPPIFKLKRYKNPELSYDLPPPRQIV